MACPRLVTAPAKAVVYQQMAPAKGWQTAVHLQYKAAFAPVPLEGTFPDDLLRVLRLFRREVVRLLQSVAGAEVDSGHAENRLPVPLGTGEEEDAAGLSNGALPASFLQPLKQTVADGLEIVPLFREEQHQVKANIQPGKAPIDGSQLYRLFRHLSLHPEGDDGKVAGDGEWPEGGLTPDLPLPPQLTGRHKTAKEREAAADGLPAGACGGLFQQSRKGGTAGGKQRLGGEQALLCVSGG